MKIIVGQVSEEERNEIQTLHERKNGLTELAKAVGDNDVLYEKLVRDMGQTASRFEQWWNRMGEKYRWQSAENGKWEIDFNTCDISLATDSPQK